jgi:hypothetical protein
MLKPTTSKVLYHYGGQGLIDALWSEELLVTSASSFDDPFEFLVKTSANDGTDKLGSVPDDAKVVQQASDDVFYALCLSRKPNDIRMWAQYGDNHRGLMLTIDLHAHQILQNFLDNELVLDVNYPENNERCDPPWGESGEKDFSPTKIKEWFTTKGRDWEHQEETRLLVSAAAFEDKSETRVGKIRPFQNRLRAFLNFPHQCITKITLGSRSSRELLLSVEKINRLKNANWTISKVGFHPTKFAFIEEIIQQD